MELEVLYLSKCVISVSLSVLYLFGSNVNQSVKIDGLSWKSNCYLDWDTFRNGSTVELELTDDIGLACGEAPDALPPSLSTGGF
jgi:hypothetical protein